MPKFESPLGSKQFAGQPLREYDIPDASEQPVKFVTNNPLMRDKPVPPELANLVNYQPISQMSDAESLEIERQIRAAKEARRTGKERLNDGARRRIEMLIGMTRLTKSVEIGENTFVLSTLKSKEIREAITAAAAFDGSVEFSFEIRRQLLARSIINIAGLDIDQFIGSNELEAKLQFTDDLDEPLLNRLYDEYLSLANEAKDKYSIKTEADVQQVSEDLKK